MKLSRIVITLALILTASSIPAADMRLGNEVRPTYQVIELKVDPSTSGYTGSTRISLKVENEVPLVRLHADGIEISRVRLEGPGGTIRTKHNLTSDELTITPSTALAPGNYGLRIEFSNEFNTQAVGLYRMEANGTGYAYTQFEAIDARKAFPCFDEPSFKIPFQMRITARESDQVVTNTPVRFQTRSEGWKTLEFHTTKPLPTYLLALAVGPMDSIEIPNLSVPGRVYTPAGQAGLATYTAKMVDPILRAQEAYFATPYPYEKLDFIAIPEYWPGAMEHPGAITYKDDILLLDPARVSAGQRRNAARVISHELAHQWFGNLVTMDWWDDLWLNEAFADWFGDKIVVQLFPEMKHDLNERRDVNNVMTGDSRVTSVPIRKPIASGADLLGDVGLAYNKGKAVIGMFERWIGQDAFRKGVNEYLRANAWGNARAQQFWNALSDAAGEDVAGAMETFLVQPGVPLVTASVEGNVVKLAQTRFANYGAKLEAQSWQIPVALRVGSEDTTAVRTVLLDKPVIEVSFDDGESVGWIIPDADGAGYYRWAVGDEQLVTIAENAVDLLNDRERVAFLGNLGALLDGGLIGGDTYMEVLGLFATDPEPLVVSAVISELGGVEEAFVTDDLRDEFAEYVERMLAPALDRFGLEASPDEDETVTGFRPRLIAWMGDVAQNESVIAWAATRANGYMSDHSSLDPAIAGVCLGILAKDGDQELYEAMQKGFMDARNPAVRANYLAALGRFEDPKIRQQALAFTLEGPLRPNELFTIPMGIADTSVGANLMFDWVTTNYAEIASKMPPLFRPYLTGIGGGCDIDRLTRAKEFFARPEHNVEGTDQQMKRVEAGVLDCVDLRQREGEKVRGYLSRAESVE
jgi:alanyl aminopeptidase